MIKVTTLGSAPKVPFQLDGKILMTRPGLEIVHLTLKPGETIPKHVNDFDVAFYVLSGDGVIETSHESAGISAGMLIEIEAGEERGLTNTGDSVLLVLVMKMLRNAHQ
jgi:quercetin dioxygenase-like cupin family protein